MRINGFWKRDSKSSKPRPLKEIACEICENSDPFWDETKSSVYVKVDLLKELADACGYKSSDQICVPGRKKAKKPKID